VPPYPPKIDLTDGGVYDNLGLETAWKECGTILISDGGGRAVPQLRPHRDWVRHTCRAFEIIDDQVRSLRTREIIAAFERGERGGRISAFAAILATTGLPTPCPARCRRPPHSPAFAPG
jgi:NTE family protein